MPKLQLWRDFWGVAKPFWFSSQRWKAAGMLALVIALMYSVVRLNVEISYLANYFTTALTNKDAPNFWHVSKQYFAMFCIGTPIVVMQTYVTGKLILMWRNWLTRNFVTRYTSNRAFFKIGMAGVVDNPDERLQVDIQTFTSSAIDYLLMALGSALMFFSFISILYSISPKLTLIVAAYTVVGTILTLIVGKPLVSLNFLQLRKEADYRFGLIHVRANAESIAFYQGEEQERKHLFHRFAEVIANYNLLLGWTRNLGFLTTAYTYLIVLIPSVVLAPLLFKGTIEYGTITQADAAFAQVLAAVSLIVGNYKGLSNFTAVVQRLVALDKALKDAEKPAGANSIQVKPGTTIGAEKLTLMTPDGENKIVGDLTLQVPVGRGLAIVGPSGSGKTSILRALAGLWTNGSGTIKRPPVEQFFFLPQRPYMTLGTLRDQLLYPRLGDKVSDAVLLDALKRVNLGGLADKVGGLDAVRPWGEMLSLGQQQLLAFARLLLAKPKFVVLDESTSAMDPTNERRVYEALKELGATFISVGHRSTILRFHDEVLALRVELKADGSETRWEIMSSADYEAELSKR